MCGIFVTYNNRGIRQDLAGHLSALRTLAHRGPDDEGTFLDATVFVGHRRLSILDPSPAGHQPMLGADGKVVLAFNGQIYNHLELKKDLEIKGYRFQSSCDTETVLNLYLEFGLSAFERLRGMWAIVIWDKRNNALIASRDRMGVKPLYLYANEGDIILASEIKAILSCRPQARAIDNITLRRYVARGWLDYDQRTMFNAIKQVPTASVSVWRDGRQVHSNLFWKMPTPRPKHHDLDYLRSTFQDVVGRHMQSDVPVATTLSGGLDSSSITSVLANPLSMGNKVRAFSVCPPDTPDESPWIDATVRHTGIDHEYFFPGKISILEALDEVLSQTDEPVFNSSCIYQALLRKHIAPKGYKVVLIGEGGDELFGGYAKVLPMFVWSLLRAGKQLQARKAITGGVSLTGLEPSKQLERIKLYRNSGIGSRTYQEYRRGYDMFSDDIEMDDSYLFPKFEHPQVTHLNEGEAFFCELLDRYRLDISHHLRNEDRIAMAHGIEARPIFVDHELIECAWSYPYELFMDGGTNKKLMRRAMRGIVEPSVLSLRKKFVRPGNNKLLAYHYLAEPIRDMLKKKESGAAGLGRKGLAALYEQDYSAQDHNHSYAWFRYYMTQRWIALKT